MADYLLPEIETERLRLRIYQTGDTVALRAVRHDPAVARCFSATAEPLTEAQVLEIILRSRERWRTRGFSQWGVTRKSDDPAVNNEIIGYCGFQPFAQTTEIEIYYGFAAGYRGQGLATETARAGLRYAFETLKAPSVAAVTFTDNQISQRILDKIGMRFKTEKRVYDVDVCYYKIHAAEYLASDDFYQLKFSEPDD